VRAKTRRIVTRRHDAARTASGRARGWPCSASKTPHFNTTAPADRGQGDRHGDHPGNKVNWPDEYPSVEPPAQDAELRRLVDLLPEWERHVVERVYFGGANSRRAAAELDLDPSDGEKLLRRGLAQLKKWLTGEEKTPRRDPHRKRDKVDAEPERRGWEALDEAALDSTMKGRYRGDGRRLDVYVLHDAAEWPEVTP
jgi:DNA-directed RNA polymerase specialized sigma24 family protein